VHGPPDDLGHSLRRERTDGRYGAQKNVVFPSTRPTFEVGKYGITDFLRERKTRLAPSFAFYQDAAVAPVDVSETKCRHVAGAQAQSRQKKNHGTIS
jgi:hypothetical protein